MRRLTAYSSAPSRPRTQRFMLPSLRPTWSSSSCFSCMRVACAASTSGTRTAKRPWTAWTRAGSRRVQPQPKRFERCSSTHLPGRSPSAPRRRRRGQMPNSAPSYSWSGGPHQPRWTRPSPPMPPPWAPSWAPRRARRSSNALRVRQMWRPTPKRRIRSRSHRRRSVRPLPSRLPQRCSSVF